MARRDRRTIGDGPYVLGARIKPTEPPGTPRTGWPWELPAVRALEGLRLDRPVTFLVGDNGAGKSTLVEGLAWALGFDERGGSTGSELGARHRGESPLGEALELELGARKPREGFFLRAESFTRLVEQIEAAHLTDAYGGVPLTEVSHGESFLAFAANRFGGQCLFLLDEPEAALSVTSALAFLGVLHRAAAAGAQFVVATHSPILLALPGARIYELSDGGADEVSWEACDPTRLMRSFLDAPDRFLQGVLEP